MIVFAFIRSISISLPLIMNLPLPHYQLLTVDNLFHSTAIFLPQDPQIIVCFDVSFHFAIFGVSIGDEIVDLPPIILLYHTELQRCLLLIIKIGNGYPHFHTNVRNMCYRIDRIGEVFPKTVTVVPTTLTGSLGYRPQKLWPRAE